MNLGLSPEATSNRFFGICLLFTALLTSSGCRSSIDLVAKPTPKSELTTTVLIPSPTGVIVETNSFGATVRLILNKGMVANSVMEQGNLNGFSPLTRRFLPVEPKLHLRPGKQKLKLGGYVSTVAEAVGGYYHGEQNHTWFLTFDFQPGLYRVAGRVRYLERLTQDRVLSAFDLWLEKERSNGVFERVATFSLE
jgi:hypothetical protein